MDEQLEPDYEAGRDIRDRAFELACGVVRLCEQMHARGGASRVMAPQLVNCSTSVAAMLEEARGAESRRDFISKCSIGLKEARETLVRLRVCRKTVCHKPGEFDGLIADATAVVRILGAIIRNCRRNAGLATSRRVQPAASV